MESNNLKTLFREIRGFFAGNVTGITRDETIAQVVISLLFCKMHDEERTRSERLFRVLGESDVARMASNVRQLFEEVKSTYPHVFSVEDKIPVSDDVLGLLSSWIAPYEISDLERDVIGDAFEEFIGTAFRGGEGQFFTPRNVVEMMVEVLNPVGDVSVIDPACGSGGFLAYALRRATSDTKKSNPKIVGIEKDSFLSGVARTYSSVLQRSEGLVFCENSLEEPTKWGDDTRASVNLDSFDFVLTNPPFGAKIPVVSQSILSQFNLAKVKEKDGRTRTREKQSPQVLFIERAVQLLKPGGKMGIVLPEGIFGNPSEKYVWDYLESEGAIFGVISLSQEAFQPSTHTKTSVLFFEKGSNRRPIFMAIASAVGHNKNGKTTYVRDSTGNYVTDADGHFVIEDDVPVITRNFKSFLDSGHADSSRLGFTVDPSEIHDQIYIPEYYDPLVRKERSYYAAHPEFELLSVGELVDSGALTITRGREIGSHFYGTGSIPFVRTSDIVNWEIKIDPIKCVSQDVYDLFQKSMDVRTDDILLVSDGTFLIGRTAIVTEENKKILIQSHLKKIRVGKKAPFDSYYLFYLLNTDFVQRQIRAKTFVQATISTLGNRIREIELPMLISANEVAKISARVKAIIDAKQKIGRETRELLAIDDDIFR